VAPGRAQRRGNVGMVDGLWSEQIDPKYTKGHDPHVTHQTKTKTSQTIRRRQQSDGLIGRRKNRVWRDPETLE